MKRLILTLLLISPFFTVGQDILLDHSYTDAADFQVGQQITIKFNMLYQSDTLNPSYVFIDFQFNNKLLQFDSATFTSAASQGSNYEYPGYYFVPNDNVENTDLFGQRQAGLNYQYDGGDWTIARAILQSGTILPDAETLVEYKFTIKDKANTAYSNYEDVTRLNWAQIRNNSTYTNYSVSAMQYQISLETVSGGDAGLVTINLNTPSLDPTHFTYRINDTGTQSQVAEGNFDENYQANVSGLDNDKKYHVYIEIDNELANEWLDEVVTVSDAFINFQQAISNTGTPDNSGQYFDYSLQYLLGEVNNSGNVTEDDSYIMLNHIMGNNVSEWFTSSVNGSKVYSGRVENYGVATNEYYFGMNPYIEPTDNSKVFNFNAGLVGDVDFSHSAIPTAGQEESTGTASRSMAKTAENAEEYNLDITTELVGGKVVMETLLTKEELAGVQFIIEYDDNILQFDSVEFDTGSEMLNFATPKGNKVYFGSLDSAGAQEVKIGVPYKLVFTPLQSITNTAGLIYFNVADAIKKDGTKIILKIQ